MIAPPRLGLFVLGFCARGAVRDALLGDLAEEFGEIARERGSRDAHAWYWAQVLRSVWPMLTSHLHRRSAGRLIGSVLLGMSILWLVGDLAMNAALGGLTAVWPGAGAPGALIEIAYLAGLVPAAVLAGYATARQGRHNGPLAAVALAGIVALPGLVALVTGVWSPPAWSHFIWFAIGPLGVLLGARQPPTRIEARR